MNWRIIQLEEHDAYFNMAADHAISEAVANGSSDPTIRFYTWKPSAVSIGCFQSMRDEVNVERCKQLGVDCVRRRTGGGAVYHATAGEITYSVIAPESIMPKGITESYREICSWVISGLKLIGIDASFVPINDIVVEGKKLSGNAQTRREGVLLQHGTVLYDLDVETMFSLLNVSKEKISDKAITDVRQRVGRVLDYAEVAQEWLYEALLEGFASDKSYTLGRMSIAEIDRAKQLAAELYASDDWNFSR